MHIYSNNKWNQALFLLKDIPHVQPFDLMLGTTLTSAQKKKNRFHLFFEYILLAFFSHCILHKKVLHSVLPWWQLEHSVKCCQVIFWTQAGNRQPSFVQEPTESHSKFFPDILQQYDHVDQKLEREI